MAAQDEVSYSSFNKRILASIIDTVLSAIALIPLFELISTFVNQNKVSIDTLQKTLLGQPLTSEELLEIQNYLAAYFTEISIQIFIIGIIVFIFWVYRAATPGKMILRMRIADADSLGEPSKIQYIIRYLGYIVSTLPFGLGFLWIAFHKRHQGWHDLIARTVVIDAPKETAQ